MPTREEMLQSLLLAERKRKPTDDTNEEIAKLIKKVSDSILPTPVTKIAERIDQSSKTHYKCIFTIEQNAVLGRFSTKRFIHHMDAMWAERLESVEPELRRKAEKLGYYDPGFTEAGICECGQAIRYHFIYKGARKKTRIANHLGTSKVADVVGLTENDLLIGSTCLRTFMKVSEDGEKFLLSAMNEVNKERDDVAERVIEYKADFEKWLKFFVLRASEFFTNPTAFGDTHDDAMQFIEVGLPIPHCMDDEIVSKCRVVRMIGNTQDQNALVTVKNLWRIIKKYYPKELLAKLNQLAAEQDNGGLKQKEQKLFHKMLGRLTSSYVVEAAKLAKKLEETKMVKEDKQEATALCEKGFAAGFSYKNYLKLKYWRNIYKEAA